MLSSAVFVNAALQPSCPVTAGALDQPIQPSKSDMHVFVTMSTRSNEASLAPHFVGGTRKVVCRVDSILFQVTAQARPFA